MKKTFVKTLILSAASALILASCNYEIPETVTVKTKAEYNVELGTASYDVGQYLSASKLASTLKESAGSSASSLSVYDFVQTDDASTTDIDESDIQAYLVHYPVFSTDFDISSMISGLDLDSVLGSADAGVTFSQTISVPEVSLNQSQTVSIPDMGGTINDAIQSSIDSVLSSFGGNIPFTEGAASLAAGQNLNISLNASSVTMDGCSETISFGKVYFDNNAFSLKFTRTDSESLGSNYDLSVLIVVYDSDGNLIGASDTDGTYTSITDGGTISVSVPAGLPGDATLQVLFNGQSDGTILTNTTIHTYTIAYDGDIAKVDGINASSAALGLDTSVTSFDQSVSMESVYGYFTTATIGSGSFTIAVTEPSNITGLSASDSSITLNGAGLENLTFTDASDQDGYIINKILDLSGQTLAPSSATDSIEVSGSFGIALTDATIVFSSGSSACELTVSVGGSIGSLANAVIDFTTDRYSSMVTSYTLDGTSENAVELPSEIIEFVNSISFPEYQHSDNGVVTTTALDGVGLQVKYINTLPCDISGISIASNVFNLSLNVDIDTTTSEGTTADWTTYTTVDFSQYRDSSDPTYVDLTVNLPTSLTVTNLVLGTDYEVGIESATLVYDWDYVSVNTDSSTFRLSDSMSLDGFSMSDMLSSLNLDTDTLKKLGLSKLDAYFYLKLPDISALSSIGLDGTVNLNYTDSDGNAQTSTILDGTLTALDDDISWPDEGSSIKESDATYLDSIADGKGIKIDIADIINDFPSDFSVNYDIGMVNSNGESEITLYKKTIESLLSTDEDADTSISLDLAAVLPLQITVASEVNIDVLDLIGTTIDSDLFGRSEATDIEQYNQYLDVVKEFSLKCKIVNNILDDSCPFALTVSQDWDNGESFSETIDLTSKSVQTINLKDDAQTILTNYPFTPSVELTLGSDTATSLYVSRSAMEEGEMGIDIGVLLDLGGEGLTLIGGSN